MAIYIPILYDILSRFQNLRKRLLLLDSSLSFYFFSAI